MNKVRFKYSKTGKSKYISHLDLMKNMQRAFIRAGIKLKYSQGFNPHPYMSVALPLSVGNESVWELIDIALEDDCELDIEKLEFPEGLVGLTFSKPERKFSEIVWVSVVCKMQYDFQLNIDFVKKVESCFNKENLIITKKTKRGHKELNIVPFIKDIKFYYDDSKCITMTAIISAQNPTISCDDLSKVLSEDLKPESTTITRLVLYDNNMVVFN